MRGIDRVSDTTVCLLFLIAAPVFTILGSAVGMQLIFLIR